MEMKSLAAFSFELNQEINLFFFKSKSNPTLALSRASKTNLANVTSQSMQQIADRTDWGAYSARERSLAGNIKKLQIIDN